MPRAYRPDLSGIAGLLLGNAPERYPFEREIEWIAFQTWLLSPDQPALVPHGKRVSAARAMRGLLDGEEWTKGIADPLQNLASIVAHVFEPRAITEVLLDHEFIFRFRDDLPSQVDGLWGVERIVEFFLSVDSIPSLKPSLNKAMFFIDYGGYGKDAKRSLSSLKNDWVKYAVCSPFIYAAGGFDFDDFWIAPDDEDAIAHAANSLDEEGWLQDFFGQALHTQNALLKNLDRSTVKRFKFLDFPDFIKPIPAETSALDAEQLKILKEYRAPKAI